MHEFANAGKYKKKNTHTHKQQQCHKSLYFEICRKKKIKKKEKKRQKKPFT
jgi:hypothetical protein